MNQKSCPTNAKCQNTQLVRYSYQLRPSQIVGKLLTLGGSPEPSPGDPGLWRIYVSDLRSPPRYTVNSLP
jgi:hypothetical protein